MDESRVSGLWILGLRAVMLLLLLLRLIYSLQGLNLNTERRTD